MEDQRGEGSVLNYLKDLILQEKPQVRVDCGSRPAESPSVPCTAVVELRAFNVKVGIATAKTPEELAKLFESKRALRLDKLVVIVWFNVDPTLQEILKADGIEVIPADKALRLAGLVSYEVKRAEVAYVQPKIEGATLKRIIEKYQGKIFRRGDYGGHRLIFIPIYDVDTTLYRIDYTSAPLESLRILLSFEGLTGSLVEVDSQGTLYLAGEWDRIGDLTIDEIEVLKFIAREGMASYSEIQAHFEWENVEAIIEVLMEKGLIIEIGDYYQVKAPNLKGYRGVGTALRELIVKGRPAEGLLLEPEVSPAMLAKVVSLIGEIENINIIYYPAYIISYIKRSGSGSLRSYILVSGVSGERMDDIEELAGASRLSSLIEAG